jgi:hypothetical protein
MNDQTRRAARAGTTEPAKVVAAINQIKGLQISNGVANFSPTQRLLVAPKDLGMFEYVKNDKGQVVLSITKQ